MRFTGILSFIALIALFISPSLTSIAFLYEQGDKALMMGSSVRRVSWVPGSLNVVVSPGTSKSYSLEFSSSQRVDEASIFIVPGLSSFISIEDIPNELVAGQVYSNQVAVEVPIRTKPGFYQGTIHIKSGRATVPSPLPVIIQVVPVSNEFLPNEPSTPSSDRIITFNGQQEIVKDEIIVILNFETANPSQRITQIANLSGGVITGAVPSTLTYQLRYDVSNVDTLEGIRAVVENLPDVEVACLSFLGAPLRYPNDSKYDSWDEANPGGNNWGLEYIRAPSAWDLHTGSDSVIIGIIDGDFESTHEDLAANISSSVGARTKSYKGHGTEVAGVIGAVGDNDKGVAGVAWRCSLKLYDYVGGGKRPTPITLAVQMQAAMIRAAQEGARIVNISDGFVRDPDLSETDILRIINQTSPIISKAIRSIQRDGLDVLWIVAAGNEERDARFQCPANLANDFPGNVMAIAAIGPDGNLTSFSNHGSLITVAAPGQAIFTTQPPHSCILPEIFCEKYGFTNGTSMAAPFVSGVAGLMLSENPDLTAADLRRIIKETAKHSGNQDRQGNEVRILDALAAVQRVRSIPSTCAFPPLGLAGWWDGDGNAIDAVNSNNGILSGSMGFITGNVGQAFRFDGIDDHVFIPAASNLNVGMGAGMSIEGWIKPDDISQERPLVEWNDGSTNFTGATQLWISVPVSGGGPGSLFANLPDTNQIEHRISSPPGSIRTDTYQHIALTYDKSSGIARLYVNGQVVAENNLGSFTPKTATDLYFGLRPINNCSSCAPGARYIGAMDEISIYNRALTVEEIRNITSAAASGKCKQCSDQTGANIWTANGPSGAQVRSLVIDPNAPGIIYAATQQGVYKSTDNAVSWTVINTGLSDTDVQTLEIDPTNSSVLYAGTFAASGSGVFKSINGGATWAPTNNGLVFNRIFALKVSPANSSIVYAGTLSGGVFKSTDGGASWIQSNNDLANVDVRALAIHPTSPSTIYAGTQVGIFKSTDGGATWTQMNNGLSEGSITAVQIDPLIPSTVYASAFSITGSALFKTTNAGASWVALSTGVTSSAGRSVVINPIASRIVYLGTQGGIFRSTDGGISWSPLNNGLTNLDVRALTINPSSNQLRAGTFGSGVFSFLDDFCQLNANR